VQFTHPNFCLGIVGKRGSGKTSYFLRWLTHSRYHTRFVFDGEGELAGRLGLPAARTPAQLLEALPSGWVVFDPQEMFPGHPLRGFEFFSDWSFRLAERLPGRKLFAADELWRYTCSAVIPPAFEVLLFKGRRVGLDCAFVSQRLNRIHNAVRDTFSEVVAFRHQDKNSIEFLRDNGFDEEAVRRLRPGEWIARNLDYDAEDRGQVFAATRSPGRRAGPTSCPARGGVPRSDVPGAASARSGAPAKSHPGGTASASPVRRLRPG